MLYLSLFKVQSGFVKYLNLKKSVNIVSVLGFSFLFSLMDPVPWEVKVAFHIFGLITFVTGIIFTLFTSMAGECVSYKHLLRGIAPLFVRMYFASCLLH